MGKAMDYNDFAKDYALYRSAFPWVIDPIASEIKLLPQGSTIAEIGCGTGNYIIHISEILPEYTYRGFDLSDEMLNVARSRSNKVLFTKANADVRFPYDIDCVDTAFAVDVIHHITQYEVFFNECCRVLKQNSSLIIVTDTEEDHKKRSGIKFFPETLEIERERYPKVEELNGFALNSGLEFISSAHYEGLIEIDDEFISRVKNKFSSSMRLMKDEDHKRGVERLKEAKKRGEKWLSSSTILKYKKLNI